MALVAVSDGWLVHHSGPGWNIYAVIGLIWHFFADIYDGEIGSPTDFGNALMFPLVMFFSSKWIVTEGWPLTSPPTSPGPILCLWQDICRSDYTSTSVSFLFRTNKQMLACKPRWWVQAPLLHHAMTDAVLIIPFGAQVVEKSNALLSAHEHVGL